jgi:hypothetical protein
VCVRADGSKLEIKYEEDLLSIDTSNTTKENISAAGLILKEKVKQKILVR